MFSENAKVHFLLNEFVLKLIYNEFSNELWNPEYLNSIDREDLGEQFVNIFIQEYEEEIHHREKHRKPVPAPSLYLRRLRNLPRSHQCRRRLPGRRSGGQCHPAGLSGLWRRQGQGNLQ